ncbi:phosphonopyruvate decarboxylase [Vreelandella aquamarina]|uniref:phosphonopyruvate decarboxylase n=1 Tax=Vreelandella aquamarina TaxID=77097 RepID=UPI00384F4A46
MIAPHAFFDALTRRHIDFFTGVPDSLLKHFCAFLDETLPAEQHLIAANEGNAVAIAAGRYMATQQPAMVYLQNSGLGNTLNPLASLADADVYRLPMLLLIGWRGEPGVKDEPQHVKQGQITPGQLDLLGIPYQVLDADSDPEAVMAMAQAQLDTTHAPVALLVKKDTFAPHPYTAKANALSDMTREQALTALLPLMDDAAIVATTGKTSRELFELRVAAGQPQRDFLTVGSMGHTASIALGVALGRPDKPVVCLDGDGSLLMHLGALPIIGSQAPANLTHVLLNNAAHESVGGQPTVAGQLDFAAMAHASGYRAYAQASSLDEIHDAWNSVQHHPGPRLLEVRIAPGSRSDLGRPTKTPQENRDAFMEWLAQ